MTHCKHRVIDLLFLLTFLLFFNNCQNRETEEGFVSIFDGKSLNGWEGDSTYWSIEDGNLVGTITPETLLKHNSFIIWKVGTPEDFELKLEYRISEEGNSGINYRSEVADDIPFALKGYQFDLDGQNHYSGQNYEERKRTTLAYRGQSVIVESLPDSLAEMPMSTFIKNNAWTRSTVTDSTVDLATLDIHIKDGDWNHCHLIARGNKMQHFINGILMSEVVDNDKQNKSTTGHIGVQVHVGPPMKVEFRNIMLKTIK